MANGITATTGTASIYDRLGTDGDPVHGMTWVLTSAAAGVDVDAVMEETINGSMIEYFIDHNGATSGWDLIIKDEKSRTIVSETSISADVSQQLSTPINLAQSTLTFDIDDLGNDETVYVTLYWR